MVYSGGQFIIFEPKKPLVRKLKIYTVEPLSWSTDTALLPAGIIHVAPKNKG